MLESTRAFIVSPLAYASGVGLRTFAIALAVYFALHVLAPQTSYAYQVFEYFLPRPFTLLCLFMGLAIAGFILSYRYAKTMALSLSAERLTLSAGALIETNTVLPLDNIKHLTTQVSLLDRLFRTATLNLYTTGAKRQTLSLKAVRKQHVKDIERVVSP
jgi:membrane protein YdbS with pleckstrin-like domain